MALTYTFACPLPNGVHARPASALEEVARRFAATVSLTNERTGQAANAKSVLGIVGLEIRLDDRCNLLIEGVDETSAFGALAHFVENELAHCDDALPIVAASSGLIELPRMLRHASVELYRGTAVVPGIGTGHLVRLGRFTLPASVATTGVDDIDAETARVEAALQHLNARYDEQLARATAGVQAAVLRAHRSVARDPDLRQTLLSAVRNRRLTAAGALADAEARFTAMLLASSSTLLRERALDVRDVCRQLLRELYGAAIAGDDPALTADTICLADALTPSQFLALDRRFLKGLALAEGGTTSHTVILARSFGIPTLVGVADIPSAGVDAEAAVLDADLGVLVTRLTDAARRYYSMERVRLEDRRSRLQRFQHQPAHTQDGARIEIGANVGTAEEAVRAFASGAEGIGLFRTEFLFLDRDAPPTEDEQFEEYRRALAAAGDRSVIIRTLDVGGDKPIAYLRLPPEANPFLGYRAVRLYPEFETLFRTQVRALLRASAFGRLKVMVPMVSGAEEVRWFRGVIAQEQARLGAQGVAMDPRPAVGAMVEVPSLAFLIDHLAADLDFFSIGTNDLLQYFTAVDRTNRRVAPLYNGLNPAFLRLLGKIVADAHTAGRWVGMCGELGGDRRALPLLVGLGLDEISMAAPAIVRTKADMSRLTTAACIALLDQALACSEPGEVEELVQRFDEDRPAPLVDADLVMVGGAARTKEEAIKQAVDRLYVVGRTDVPREIEDAVWRREGVYSTGFGHGFAMPHCKTNAVRANSLVVLKLDTPVEWGSLDEKPVGVLILLAIRESDQTTAHMKVLASLARKVMHQEFREALAREMDPQRLAAFLRDAPDS